MKTKVNLTLAGGTQQDVFFQLEDYKAAEEAKMSLAQFINTKYETQAGGPTAYEQCLVQSGIIMAEDRTYGLRPPTIKQLLEGSTSLAGGVVVAPNGDDRLTPAGRYFFPSILLESLESSLRDNREGYNAQFMSMVGQTRTITSPRYDQVLIDFSVPRAARGMPIAQNAEPVRMLSITTSQRSKTILTKSIGMEISKQAQEASTLDLIAIAFREHGLEERSAQLDQDFMGIVNGDNDSGEAGIITAAVSASTYDPSLAPGEISQRAWVKFLRTNYRKRNITHAVMDIDTYLELEGRLGRPTRAYDAGTDERLNVVPRVLNPGLPNGIQIFVMDSFLADTIVGLDASKAMRRIVYTGAEYSAVEEFLMRRSTAFRVDWAERIESAGYAEAFAVMTLD